MNEQQQNDEQSKYDNEEASGDSSAGNNDNASNRLKKTMSKVASRLGRTKSSVSVKRRKSELSMGDTVEIVLEPIVPPSAVPLDQLKEGYYRDLRMTLVPPPFPPDTSEADVGPENRSCAERDDWTTGTRYAADGLVGGPVARRLRDMLDAIDEMDRALDGVNVSVFDCVLPTADASDATEDAAATTTTAADLPECATMPLRSRMSKPDAGIRMRTYRVGGAKSRRPERPTPPPVSAKPLDSSRSNRRQ